MLWFWGLAGAFIYAAPRWVIGLSSVKDSGKSATICTLEMIVALVVGAAAAGMFGGLAAQLALTALHIKDDNAVCGLIGLFANRLAPELVEKGSSAFSGSASVIDKILKALKGEEK